MKFKYNEDVILQQVARYVESTYGEHYAHEVDNKGMQLFDLWEGLEIAAPTCQATALKYITRYGRKDGYNKKDLLKAIHYILLLWHYTQDKDNTESNR